MEAHTVVRRRGSQIFETIGSQMAVRCSMYLTTPRAGWAMPRPFLYLQLFFTIKNNYSSSKSEQTRLEQSPARFNRVPVFEITLELTCDKEANTEFKSFFKLCDWIARIWTVDCLMRLGLDRVQCRLYKLHRKILRLFLAIFLVKHPVSAITIIFPSSMEKGCNQDHLTSIFHRIYRSDLWRFYAAMEVIFRHRTLCGQEKQPRNRSKN
jgi:hypothetical protein